MIGPGKKGGGGGGGGKGKSELDKYIRFDAKADLLRSTKVLEVPKFKVGEIQAVVSGIENILFRNELTGTSWASVRQGIKDQRIPENRGPEGLIEPTFRSYGGSTHQITTGEVGTKGVEAKAYIPMTSNRSVNGIGFYPTKSFKKGDIIHLKTFYGIDSSGIPVNREPYKFPEDYTPGDQVVVYLSYPVDVKDKTQTYFMICDSKGAPIKVRNTTNTAIPTVPFFSMYHRLFEDKIIRGAAKPEIVNLSSTLDGQHDITKDLNTTQSFNFTVFNSYAITGPVEIWINDKKYTNGTDVHDGPNSIQVKINNLTPKTGTAITYVFKYHDVYGKLHSSEIEAGHWVHKRSVFWGVREINNVDTINPKDLKEVKLLSWDYFDMGDTIPTGHYLMILTPITHEMYSVCHEGHSEVNALSSFTFSHNSRTYEGYPYSTYVLKNEGTTGSFNYKGRVKG